MPTTVIRNIFRQFDVNKWKEKEVLGTIVTERAVCGDVDVLLFAVFDKFGLWEEGVRFNLIGNLMNMYVCGYL
jgi:hypothetical protein